jgi:hypothetical protein
LLVRYFAQEFRMPRPITIVGAPSTIGIRPYDDGTPRRLDPALDPDRSSAARLTSLLQRVLAGNGDPTIHREGFWESLARSHA